MLSWPSCDLSPLNKVSLHQNVMADAILKKFTSFYHTPWKSSFLDLICKLRKYSVSWLSCGGDLDLQRGRKENCNDPEKDLDLLPRAILECAILETETGGQRPSPSFSFFIASMSSLRTRTQTSITNDRSVVYLKGQNGLLVAPLLLR